MAFRHWKYILKVTQEGLNFVKSYILSCFLQFDNESEITKLVFELYMLKAKFKGVLTSCTVAMVTPHIKRMTATCLPNNRAFV